eukprot:UN24467
MFSQTMVCQFEPPYDRPPAVENKHLANELLKFYSVTKDERPLDKIKVGIVQRRTRRKIANYEYILHQCNTLLNYECFGFEVETISTDILKLFRTIHVFVYMHGSAGTNGLFLPNGSSVVEIMPYAAQQFGYRLYSWWMYNITYAHYERIQIANRTWSLTRHPVRWQMADQYIPWKPLMASIVASGQAVQKKSGFNSDMSNEEMALTWSEDILDKHCVLVNDIWFDEAKLYYKDAIVYPKMLDMDLKEFQLEKSNEPMPYKQETCAKHWLPIVFSIKEEGNMYELWKNVIVQIYLLKLNKMIDSYFPLIINYQG